MRALWGVSTQTSCACLNVAAYYSAVICVCQEFFIAALYVLDYTSVAPCLQHRRNYDIGD
nr:MAG TPA: hypothetical protein [Caudoviricetes sp.]